MEQMVNGRIVGISPKRDGSINSDDLRRAARIPPDRPLILQQPDGSNRIINPGENVRVPAEQFFIDAPIHNRG